MLSMKGSEDKLVNCGMSTVGDQLKLRKLVEQLQVEDSTLESSTPKAYKSSKPSGKAIGSELHRRVYNAK